MVFIASKLTLVAISFCLEYLLTVSVSLVVFPFSGVNFYAVLERPLAVRDTVCYLSLVIGALCDESTVSPHIVILPSPLVKRSVSAEDENSLSTSNPAFIGPQVCSQWVFKRSLVSFVFI